MLQAKVVGLESMQGRLKILGPRGRKSVAGTLYRFGEMIMTDAKQNYVPVKENVLRTSGKVELPIDSGNTISVSMSFGGAASAYALAIHEHLAKSSPHSWKIAESHGGVHFRVGGPKYLELPYMKHTDGGKLEAQIASDLSVEWSRL